MIDSEFVTYDYFTVSELPENFVVKITAILTAIAGNITVSINCYTYI